MARIRYLKPEFFTDEDLAELTPIARLTFAGLWCHADKAGRLKDRPKYLKAVIFPYDNVDMEKQLVSLAQPKHTGRPFIQRYSLNGSSYIQILTWEDHQKPHHTEAESQIPEPPPLKKEESNKEERKEDKGNGECLERFSELKDGLKTVKKPLLLGAFGNVSLSEEEYAKLKERFGEGDTKDRIERLSEYLASSGKKYRNHYATILAWARKDGVPDKKANPNKMVCRNCGKEVSALVGGICWTCKGTE